MSRHRASSAPAFRATKAAPAAPPAGPDRTVQEARPAAASMSDQAAVRLHDRGLGQARLAYALGEPAEIARQQGRQSRRRSRWSRRARTRGTCRRPRATARRGRRGGRLRGPRRSPARGRGGGRSGAAPPRPPRALLRRLCRRGLWRLPGRGRGAGRPESIRSGAPKPELRQAHERRRPCRAQTVELRPVLAPERDHVGETLRSHECGPRHAPLEQGVGGDRHPMGELADLVRGGAGLVERGVDRRHHALGLDRRGSWAPSP